MWKTLTDRHVHFQIVSRGLAAVDVQARAGRVGALRRPDAAARRPYLYPLLPCFPFASLYRKIKLSSPVPQLAHEKDECIAQTGMRRFH